MTYNRYIIYNIYMKIPPFDSLVWGLLRLGPMKELVDSLTTSGLVYSVQALHLDYILKTS